jgi:hypothetical protein
LKSVFKHLGPKAELEIIEGADHSFNVPKSYMQSVSEVYGKIAERSIRWIQGQVVHEGNDRK